jgi:hypothetical protein
MVDINKVPMVRVTWLDARKGWLKKIEYLTVSYSEV